MSQDPNTYDAIYKTGGAGKEYFKPYYESLYYPMWVAARNLVMQVPGVFSVLDVGCGVGQFAELILRTCPGIHYQGLDFSPEAIKQARERVGNVVECGDAFTSNLVLSDYNAFLFLEVLEHIPDDIKLLQRLKTGSMVVLSVPNYPASTHVRYFPTLDDVLARYSQVLSIDKSYVIPQASVRKQVIYLLRGRRL